MFVYPLIGTQRICGLQIVIMKVNLKSMFLLVKVFFLKREPSHLCFCPRKYCGYFVYAHLESCMGKAMQTSEMKKSFPNFFFWRPHTEKEKDADVTFTFLFCISLLTGGMLNQLYIVWQYLWIINVICSQIRPWDKPESGFMFMKQIFFCSHCVTKRTSLTVLAVNVIVSSDS